MTLREAPPPWSPPPALPARWDTERLTARYWEPGDAPGLFAALEVDRASFLPWLPWVRTGNRDIGECLASIERFRATRSDPSSGDYVIGLFDRRTGVPVGGTGYHRIDFSSHTAEVGYWVRADRRREGLCTEAVAGLLTWAFTPQHAGGWGFRRIVIFGAGANEPSRRVAERLGLRREVCAPAARWTDGLGWDDTIGWGVLAEEWMTPRRWM